MRPTSTCCIAALKADADRWLAEVYRLLATLKQMPERCGLAYEAHIVQEPLRQLLIGKDQSCFRTLFIVRRQRVFVLRLRHAARRPVQRAQLGLNEVEENADG